jgi:hypothetical protein
MHKNRNNEPVKFNRFKGGMPMDEEIKIVKNEENFIGGRKK